MTSNNHEKSRNIPLLERTLQHVLDHPEHHAQIAWILEVYSNRDDLECGTAACFAGWAVMLDGLSNNEVHELQAIAVCSATRTINGVAIEARKRLGLTQEEADILFDGRNTREMLALIVKDLVNGDELQSSLFYFATATLRHHVPDRTLMVAPGSATV